MPKYALFLRNDAANHEGYTAEDHRAYFQKFVHWAEKLHGEKRLHGVERLEGRDGRTVRQRGGALVVDGPYVEGKEAVLGLFIVEADDEAEATRIASECPCVAAGGSVEVRLVGDFPKPSRAGERSGEL